MTTLTKDDANEPKCDADIRCRKAATGEKGEIKVFMRMERTMMAGSEELVVRER